MGIVLVMASLIWFASLDVVDGCFGCLGVFLCFGRCGVLSFGEVLHLILCVGMEWWCSSGLFV